MTTRFRRSLARAGVVGVVGLVGVLVLVGCSDDGVEDVPPAGDSGPSGVGSYGEVDPDISPRGYAALGCSIHASQATLDPGDLINRRDAREAAYASTWSLLVAAGVWNDEAYGALVEPASGLEFVHPQGEWERVAAQRSDVTGECDDVSRVAIGPHVYAAYACRITDRIAGTAPSVHDVTPNRITTAADEVNAVAHLARAAAADDAYAPLHQRADRLHDVVLTEGGSEAYAATLDRVVAACTELDRGA